jgi:predicted nucleic acid-binding Zn ribbon protein
VTPRRPKLCVVCGATLERQPKGRGKRFCGVACRMAAYRRRRQGVTEKMPRWEGPRGRLRLSRLRAFEGEQIVRLAWEQQRAERGERHSPDPLPTDWMCRQSRLNSAADFGTPVLPAPGSPALPTRGAP